MATFICCDKIEHSVEVPLAVLEFALAEGKKQEILNTAARYGNITVLQYMWDLPDMDQNTALWAAYFGKQVDVITRFATPKWRKELWEHILDAAYFGDVVFFDNPILHSMDLTDALPVAIYQDQYDVVTAIKKHCTLGWAISFCAVIQNQTMLDLLQN